MLCMEDYNNFDLDELKVMKKNQQDQCWNDEVAYFAQEANDEYEEPSNFEAAWNNNDLKIREKWREAITKEFKDMETRKVWKVIKKNLIPPTKRCVKCKWVFKVKRNGIFRARLVACGYSQIPGIDHDEVYAPVVNDLTFRVLLVLMIIHGLDAKIVDVETAFLHGDLEGIEIYMDCPKGLKAEKDECLVLNKTIYGLVQSARQFFKKLKACLKDLGFKGGEVDPCLMYKKTDKGRIYVAIYVDDCLFCGTTKMIEDTIEGIKKHGLEVKVEDNMTDYLSCNVVFDKDKQMGWLGQPHLLNNLKKKFGDMVRHLQTYRTPGTPNLGILKIDKNDPSAKVDDETHSLYRSGVGMLLYLVKHSRPDIANAVRELSKVMDAPSEAAMKELKRAIKFVLDTEDFGLKIKPTKQDIGKWKLVVFTDSDWAGDKDTRLSVTGYVLFLLGVPILWRSKGQKSIALSSSEAEYYALSEAAKDIKFTYMLMTNMGLKVELPIIVHVDNVGALFMTENISTSGRTKHLDLRMRYVNNLVEEGFLKFVFVRSAQNKADHLTKNVNGETYENHVNDFVIRKNLVSAEKH